MSYENVPKNLTEKAVLTRGGAPDYTKLEAAAFPVPTALEAGAILENSETGERYRWTGAVWVQHTTNVKITNLPLTAFGSLQVANLTPITQISAQYGLLSNVLTVVDSAASGTASAIDEKFNCSTGTAAAGLCSILSRRQLGYRAGQGAVAKFTAIFDTPAALANQAAGLITAENLFVFAYIGTVFGILHAFDGHNELQELTLTVAAGAENVTVTVDGIAYIVALTGIGTVQDDAFELAIGLTAQVPNYTFTSNNDQVVVQAVISEPQGAFAYASAGTSVGAFVQLTSGSPPTFNFIPQASWNLDTRINADPIINLDHQLGNVYKIQFQYLGFGAIIFYIEDNYTGKFVPVHIIRYANTATTATVNNPTFRVGWLARNVGNTTDINVQGASASAEVEGKVFRDNPPRSKAHNQLAIGASLTNIYSIRNRTSFGGKLNRAELLPLLISVSTQSAKFAFFEILINPVFAAPVNFAYTDKANSISEVATDKVAVSGGQTIGANTVVKEGAPTFSFNQDEAKATVVFPGDIICIAASVPIGAAADCQAVPTWQEDL